MPQAPAAGNTVESLKPVPVQHAVVRPAPVLRPVPHAVAPVTTAAAAPVHETLAEKIATEAKFVGHAVETAVSHVIHPAAEVAKVEADVKTEAAKVETAVEAPVTAVKTVVQHVEAASKDDLTALIARVEALEAAAAKPVAAVKTAVASVSSSVEARVSDIEAKIANYNTRSGQKI